MECKNQNCCKRNSVPFVAHESAMARRERTQKRLIAVIALLIMLLAGTNVYWAFLNQNSSADIAIEKVADAD